MDTKDGTNAAASETPAPINETNPATNDTAGAAPAQLDQSRDHTGDQLADAKPMTDPEFEARMAAERAAFEKARAETPVQTVKLRPESGQKLLGLVVHDHTGKVLRCARMEDWRSDQVNLRLGDCLVVHVLAGDGLDHFEFFEKKLLAEKEPPAPAAAAPETTGGGAPNESENGAGAQAEG